VRASGLPAALRPQRLPPRETPGRWSRLCPVGIRIFANALVNVASLNGMELRTRSWRHGSISRRIAFLESLEGRSEAERRFQVEVRRPPSRGGAGS